MERGPPMVGGVEAAIGAAGAQAARQRLRRVAKQGLVRVLLGLPKFGWLKSESRSPAMRTTEDWIISV